MSEWKTFNNRRTTDNTCWPPWKVECKRLNQVCVSKVEKVGHFIDDRNLDTTWFKKSLAQKIVFWTNFDLFFNIVSFNSYIVSFFFNISRSMYLKKGLCLLLKKRFNGSDDFIIGFFFSRAFFWTFEIRRRCWRLNLENMYRIYVVCAEAMGCVINAFNHCCNGLVTVHCLNNIALQV